MFKRFAESSRETFVEARSECHRLKHRSLGAAHLLIGATNVSRDSDDQWIADTLASHNCTVDVIRQVACTADSGTPFGEDEELLNRIGIDLNSVREDVDAIFGPGALDFTRQRQSDSRSMSATGFAFRRRRQNPRRMINNRKPSIGSDFIRLGNDAKAATEQALRISLETKSKTIEPAHLVLAILDQNNERESNLAEEVGAVGVELHALIDDLLQGYRGYR